MYYIYILQSQKNHSFYIGYTNNLLKRIQRHNKGYNKSTKTGRPWILMYKENFRTRSEAMAREKEIKNKKSRAFIEKLINMDR